MQVQPYLNFDGRCEEAIEFYKRALGAKVETLTRFKDGPERTVTDGPFAETKELIMPPPPGGADKVVHASFRVGDTTLMASDGECGGRSSFQGFSLSITVPSDDVAERLFAALRNGGQGKLPLTKTFFSPRFGIAVDLCCVQQLISVTSRRSKTRLKR